MLIDDAIEDAKRNGLLFPVRSVASWAAEPRAFLKCKELHEEIEKHKADPSEKVRQRWAKLEAAMIHFVEGGLITRNRLKILEPPKFENWELINKRPRPSLRVFGSFAKPDVFVGTHVQIRNKLKGKFSVEFEIERIRSEEIWKRAGLPPPFTDAPHFRFEAYITSNARERILLS